MSRTTSIAAATALSGILVITACSSGSEPTRPTPPAPPSVTSSPSTEPSSPADPAEESATTGNTDSAGRHPAPSTDNRPTGLTDRQSGEPTPIDKTIARCAKRSEGLYEQGTTWFTDGTTGWTTYCAGRFNDGPPPAPVPAWTPEPTYTEPATPGDGPGPSHEDGGLPSGGDAGGGY